MPDRLRFGEAALYPLRGEALATLIVLTLLGILAWLPGAGMFLSIAIYFSGYKYAFEILLATANDRTAAPILIVEAGNGDVWRMLGLLLALLLLVWLANKTGFDWAAWVLLGGFALLQPAIVVSLALDDGLLHAANPVNALRMIERIGAAYFPVAGVLLLFQTMVALAAIFLQPVLPGFFIALLVDAAFYWGLFACFRVLGLTIYLHRDALGFTPSTHADALPTLQDHDRALLERVDAKREQGDLQGALALLRDELADRPASAMAHERYLALLNVAGDAGSRDAHAVRFLGVLAQEKQAQRALGLMRESLSRNPEFALADPEHGEWLATRARELGQLRLATDIWRSLLRADPRHPHAPDWALCAAETLHERLNDVATARSTLQAARSASRDDAACARLDAALNSLPAD